MDKDAMGGPFPHGGANTAYTRYFVGDSYLNMLSTESIVIGNVTFEPVLLPLFYFVYKIKNIR